MVSLGYIVSNSGDSIIEDYSYSHGILTLTLDIDELDRRFKLMIKTDTMSVENSYLEHHPICWIEIKELVNVLSLQYSFYIPAATFEKVMKETRLNYHLAYGKKTSEVKYIFSLVGSGRLLSCLLSDLNCITIEEL